MQPARAHEAGFSIAADKIVIKANQTRDERRFEFISTGVDVFQIANHDPALIGATLIVRGVGLDEGYTGPIDLGATSWRVLRDDLGELRGYKYRDKKGGEEGITKVVLERGRIAIEGEGANWGWKPRGRQDEVWVHLYIEDEHYCSAFDPVGAEVLKNKKGVFKAKHSVAPMACPSQVCGNGRLEPGEECDDANRTDGDGCSRECALPIVPEPDIEVSPVSVDFGTVTVDQTGGRWVAISNAGDADLSISGFAITGSASFAFAVPAPVVPLTIVANEFVSVRIEYTPTGTAGDAGTLSIASDDADTPDLAVSLSGVGVAASGACDIDLSPLAVDFGSVAIGTVETRDVSVSNTGDADCAVGVLAIEGEAFALAPDGPDTPFILGPSESLDVGVDYAPGVVGEDFGSLSADSDDVDETIVVVDLAGSGFEPACEPDFQNTFDAIQSVIFENPDYGSCSVGVCHGSNQSGQLDLRAGFAYDELLVEDASRGQLARVEPGDPSASFLFDKLQAKVLGTRPSLGKPMPSQGDALTADHLEAIRLWILAGAPRSLSVQGTAEKLGVCLP